ncbi:hypothetical protein QBC46DRAFT_263030 [Diplogelasinospora grovesii]|uniref:Uncharacterized protein n=1 Tax=Diplogelasinospora grovesii TaxID=303347 RepID=A0AAN6N7F1_9PEZI|nr:hypothetical protein QBC46DRAFT_263030 [Diplogelasinospora grovesii]
MSGRDQPTRIASVEDADESGNIIEGTGRYAASVGSPTKANTSRARKEKSKRDSSSPITSGLTDSDSTVHPRRDSRPKSSSTKEREKSTSGSSKKALVTMRPNVKHPKTTPSMPRREVEASYYGVYPTVTPASSRPRAQTSHPPRPVSYYGPPSSSRPPLSNARFYPPPQLPSPGPMSFPAPSWSGPLMGVPYGTPSPGPPGPIISQQPQPDYFTPQPRPLESRFGTSFSSARPQSAMGFRQTPRAIADYEYDEQDYQDKALTRRSSMQRKPPSKHEDDRRAMPPPQRPASARPTTLAFRPPSGPPPGTPARRAVGFPDEDLIGGDIDLFHDLSPREVRSEHREFPKQIPIRSRSRRPSVGATSIYDQGDYHTEVAGRSSRRNSYYGNRSASSGSGYEDKLRQATLYQDDIAGGNPAMPLTAETLRKAGKNGGSSRSTRSSGSHDESEYRQSATTRTTRSSANNDEDVTIRVKGTTTLKVGGAEMQCQDGAEINISRNGAATPFRATSDKSSYYDQDDRRTRLDRPATRNRASSQAQSYSRTPKHEEYDPKYKYPHSRYEPTTFDEPYDSGPASYGSSYGHRPPIPPYPAYPGTATSYATTPREDDY